jgi:hypothetical protein
MLLLADYCPADAASPDYNDAAILPAMRTDTSCVRISRD